MEQLDREIELADHILVGSSFVRDTFISEGVPMEKLEVIPYGVDTSLFHPDGRRQAQDESFNIVFVGQLSQRKGLSYLLKAYQEIRDQNTSLTLVGQMQDDGSALKPWRHLLRHVPHLPRAQLAEVLQCADVFVFPTLVEGMPLSVVEAMASGLPVVTTPNGPGDIVRDGVEGYIIPPRDVDALVARLRQLKGDKALLQSMGDNAVKRSKAFTWTVYRKTVVARVSEWAGLQR
ncbi:group 1 glycosyl transferase [Salinisphaera hydrothermalis C41B8]|uniref:Group 1 glycosyl transferase n=2 Tax=Salinisphaera TaxID=180541 RepID=A0A084IQ16_SALHC|nr:group 1 glycosyl transferase [Salinisphaera hydrothermalis C41B8]